MHNGLGTVVHAETRFRGPALVYQGITIGDSYGSRPGVPEIGVASPSRRRMLGPWRRARGRLLDRWRGCSGDTRCPVWPHRIRQPARIKPLSDPAGWRRCSGSRSRRRPRGRRMSLKVAMVCPRYRAGVGRHRDARVAARAPARREAEVEVLTQTSDRSLPRVEHRARRLGPPVQSAVPERELRLGALRVGLPGARAQLVGCRARARLSRAAGARCGAQWCRAPRLHAALSRHRSHDAPAGPTRRLSSCRSVAGRAGATGSSVSRLPSDAC